MPGKIFEINDLSLKNATSMNNGGAIFVKGSLILENVIFQNNYENGVPKAMTLNGSGSLEARGLIQMIY
jgi:hypothetical protein